MYRGILIIALLIALSAFTHEMAVDHSEASKAKCLNEVRYTEGVIVNITESLNTDPKLRCLLGCMWREAGAVNEDNSFNVTKWIEISPGFKPTLVQAFNECAANKGTDLCDTAYKFYTCLLSKEEYDE